MDEPAASPAAAPEPLPSGLDEMGSASPTEVSRAAAPLRHHYGDDAIVIETQLLINAMRNGSMRATSVGVDGVRPARRQELPRLRRRHRPHLRHRDA